jgi:spore maturation protein CgeB
VVTANPSDWEGDQRTWEALAAGALVFVDRLHAPMGGGAELRHGEHVVFYDNSDSQGLARVLEHYLHHVEEASAIAERGRAFALRHHRARNRVEYMDQVMTGVSKRVFLTATSAMI